MHVQRDLSVLKAALRRYTVAHAIHIDGLAWKFMALEGSLWQLAQ